MTPTELWDIYYHAMKRWIPYATDKEVREYVKKLMDVSDDILIKNIKEGF